MLLKRPQICSSSQWSWRFVQDYLHKLTNPHLVDGNWAAHTSETLRLMDPWTKMKWSFTWISSGGPAASLINPKHQTQYWVNCHTSPLKRLWSKGLDALIWQLKPCYSLTRTSRPVKRKQQVASLLLPVSVNKTGLAAPLPPVPLSCCSFVLSPAVSTGASLQVTKGSGVARALGWRGYFLSREKRKRKKKKTSGCSTDSDPPVETSARR